jgi:membrane protease YdiL (CAAX protease family)
VLFVLPLLLVYEGGVQLVLMYEAGESAAGGGSADMFRNGADAWLRWGLAGLGLSGTFWAPVLLLVVLGAWSLLNRSGRPDDWLGAWVGMALESVAFAFVLWGLSQGIRPMVEGLDSSLSTSCQTCQTCQAGQAAPTTEPADPAIKKILSFVGAGIYEEALFRLLLFSGLTWLLLLADFPRPLAGWGAAISSALLFAAAHNFGPNGESFEPYVFIFRTLAGLYFTVLYRLRGFGVAVGAHAGYDVLVGVLAHG